jgi:hypothetical protein
VGFCASTRFSAKHQNISAFESHPIAGEHQISEYPRDERTDDHVPELQVRDQADGVAGGDSNIVRQLGSGCRKLVDLGILPGNLLLELPARRIDQRRARGGDP